MFSTGIGCFSIFAVIFRSFGVAPGCCDYAQHDGVYARHDGVYAQNDRVYARHDGVYARHDGVAAAASLQGGGCAFVSKRRLNHAEDKAALRVIDLREGVAAAAGFGAAEARDRG